MLRVSSALVFIALATTAVVFSQTPYVTDPDIVRQPQPKFKDADTTGILGDIVIETRVDAKGKVISADFLRGPGATCPTVTNPIIIAAREAAKTAALKAKFKPTADQAATSRSLSYSFGSPPDPSRKSNIVGAQLVGLTQDTSSDGKLNNKAVTLGKPKYPAAARAVRAGGSAQVQVIIDVDGTMLSAGAISGHPLLRSAAETAACGSRFMPTLFLGKPVKVAGIITYNFVP